MYDCDGGGGGGGGGWWVYRISITIFITLHSDMNFKHSRAEMIICFDWKFD